MKKLNKKGFTLIELLAVIVILAILVAVAIPAVTRYLNTARKGTYTDNAQAAIDVVRNDVISKFGAAQDRVYYLNKGCYNGEEKVTGTGDAEITTEDACTTADGVWHEYGINELLEKKLKSSPYGSNYSETSKIIVTEDGGAYTYKICLVDVGGHGIVNKAESELGDSEDVVLGTGAVCS